MVLDNLTQLNGESPNALPNPDDRPDHRDLHGIPKPVAEPV